MKLKPKFFLIFLFLSIIPVLIIIMVVYNQYTMLIQQEMDGVYERIFESAVNEANQSIADVKHALEVFAFYSDSEDSIIEDLKKYTSAHSFEYSDVFHSNNNLKFLCQNLIYSTENLNGIFIFTPSGQLLGYGNGIDIMPNYSPFTDSWYKNTVALEGKVYVNGISSKDFFIRAKPSISFSKALYDVYTHEFLGILFLDCSPDIFDMGKVNTLPDVVLLTIENDDGFILYSNVDTLAEPILNISQNRQVLRSGLDLDGLTLISAANQKLLYQEFEVTQKLIFILATIYVVLFLIISFLLSKYLTDPITYLSRKMADHKFHNYVTDEHYLNRTDEVGILYNEYNSMIEEQEKYIKSEYQNKLITLDSQMKSLEAQINSHFLYNTLESINSIAEIEGIESISTMSLALGNMFRYSIKAKSELVPVEEEISNVQDFVSIQSIRFSNRFHLNLSIPDEIYDYKVLKLILQPLVENALLHGLDRCTSGDTITISAERKENNLILGVHDNGIGMDTVQVALLEKNLAEQPHFKELGRRTTQSIGLKNISSRIELYYGQGYGMSITSRIGQGTTIYLKLPIIKPSTKESIQ